MNYLSRQRFDEISKLRFDGNLSAAIERCHDAISAYPENNFFYKVLGDLYFQEKNYMAVFGDAFIVDDHLKTILCKSDRDHHFEEIKRFIETASADEVRSLIFYQIHQENILFQL